MLGLMLTATHHRLMAESHAVQVAGHASRIQNLLTAQELDMSSLRLAQGRKVTKIRDNYNLMIDRLHQVITGLEQRLSKHDPPCDWGGRG